MLRTGLVGSVLLGLSIAGCAKKSEPEAPALHAAVTESAAPAVQAAAPANAAPAPSSALLQVGASLPDVDGVAQNGERVNLKSLAGKPIVVYFYPKDDTPGCTVEAQEIRDAYKELSGTGAVIIGVSVDDAASHKAFAEKHALPFLLVPDADQRWVKAFGVPLLPNGRASRVSFVFGRDGKLAKVFPDVKPQGHAQELGEALKTASK
ncbi:MAG TPA: peroxiredoxin [Polyangiaceae bacterium]|nr:peroxiredoxin [Polyangiaceae bacterium]